MNRRTWAQAVPKEVSECPDPTYAYDLRSRLSSVRWSAGRAEPSDFEYDAAGRLTMARNTSATVRRAYAASGRLASETQEIHPALGMSVPPLVATVGYATSADGRLSRITYPDGAAVDYEHDARVDLADRRGRGAASMHGPSPHGEWLAERAAALQVVSTAPKKIVLGRHLIAMGHKPAGWFSQVLDEAFEAQLDGVFGDEAGGLAWLTERMAKGVV